MVETAGGTAGVLAAVRVLELDGEPAIELRVYCPRLAPEGDCWFCGYEIVGGPFRRTGRAGGEDALQALILALQTASVEVELLPETKAGRVTWLGSPPLEHLLPPPRREAPGGE